MNHDGPKQFPNSRCHRSNAANFSGACNNLGMSLHVGNQKIQTWQRLRRKWPFGGTHFQETTRWWKLVWAWDAFTISPSGSRYSTTLIDTNSWNLPEFSTIYWKNTANTSSSNSQLSVLVTINSLCGKQHAQECLLCHFGALHMYLKSVKQTEQADSEGMWLSFSCNSRPWQQHAQHEI